MGNTKSFVFTKNLLIDNEALNMKLEDIKLGVIGTNFVADWLCESAKRVDGINVTAVYSRTAEKGTDFANRHGIEEVYTNIDDFLGSDIRAVYIASPNVCHIEQAIKALNQSKHVLCEKPIGLTHGEFEGMLLCADENHRVLLEAMRPEFDPALDALKNAIAEIGEVRYARFEFCQYSSRYDRFKNGEVLNAFTPSLGNAAVMDIGVYAIHTCVKMFGMPDTEKMTAHSLMMPNGFEGMGTVILPYGSFNAEILYSKIADSYQPSIIMGEKGAVTINKLSAPTEVVLYKKGEEPKKIEFEKRENNMEFELETFVRLIRAKNPGYEYLRPTSDTLKVIDRIRELSGIRFE